MSGNLDLVFASKGTAGVLRELARLRAESKQAGEDVKQSAREQTTVINQIGRAYRSTQTDVERLRDKAKMLRDAINNPMVPKVDKEKAEKALSRIDAKIKDVEGNSDKAKKSLAGAFGDSTLSLLGPFATAVGTVTAALKLIVDEMRAAQELADKAAATKLSVSAARNVVIRNMTGVDDATIQKVLKQNQQLAAGTGVSESTINLARAQALSASRGDVGASLKATRTAAKFLADRPGEVGDFAGSLLDLKKVTGTDDANVNLGLLSKVAALSRVTDPRAQANTIPTALINAKSFGANYQTGAALFAAITEGSADKTGNTSTTGTIALTEQLQRLGNKNAAGNKFIPELAGLQTARERIDVLRNDPALAEKFLIAASFEKKVEGPIRDLLLNASSEAAQSFDSNIEQIPGIDQLRASGKRALGAFARNNKLEGGAARKRALQSSVEQGRIGSPEQLSTEELELVREKLQQLGRSSVGAKVGTFIAGLKDGTSTVSPEELADLLEGEVRRLRNPTEFLGSAGVGAPGQFRRREATEEELTTAGQLDQLIEAIERSTRATEEVRDESRKQTEVIRNGGPTVGGE